MALRATGPAATGSSRTAASTRVVRTTNGKSLRSRQVRSIRAAATETEVKEAPKGTAIIGGLFAGLSKLGTTGTIQLKAKKEEEKKEKAVGGRDDNVVFVAGSTGRTGARCVRELLDAGFVVRAGARNVEAAEAALSVAATYGIIKPEQLKRVTVVPFDLGKPDGFEEAIGSANKIVCAVGAPEDQALNFGNVKKIDGEGSIALVNKAAALNVNQFVLVTSLGTGKLGWPAGVLNLFGGVLIWKREAEKALEASGMAYTIVRPGGMERPTDDYKRTHNLVLKTRDTTFGGQVSRLQVAELVAAVCRSPGAAENKVLEVVAETTAPPRAFEELLAEIPQDISREAQLSNKESVDAARAELAAAQLKSSQAAAALLEADRRVSELSARLKEVKATEAAVKKEVGPVLKQAKPLETQLADARKKAERAVLLEAASKVVLERARKAAGAGQLLSEAERAAIVEEVLNPKPAVTEAAPAPKKGSGQIFGFFGKKPEPAGPTEEEKAAAAEAEAAAAAAAAEAEAAKAKAKAPVPLFAGLFAAKPKVEEPAGPTEEEMAAAAAAEAAAAAAAAAAAEAEAAKAKAPVPLFAGLFAPKPKVEEPAPEPEPEPAPVPPPVAAKKARAVPPPPVPEPEPLVVVATETIIVEEPKPLFNVGSFFGGFVKRAEEQLQAPPQAEPEPEPTPEPAPQPVVAVAAPAPVAEPAPAPKPAPAKPPAPKPAAPALDPAEEERRRKVVEAAKAALAAEAAKAVASAPPPPKVEAPVPAPVAEKPQEAAPEPAPAAPAPVVAKKDSDFDAEDAAKRKAEAQAWIAAWKAGKASGAVALSNGASAAAPEEEPAELEPVVVANPMSKFLTNLFG